MALTARLHIQDFNSSNKGIRILELDYEFLFKTDERGARTSSIQAGVFNILIAVENDGELLGWMLKGKIVNSGKIVFIGKENGKTIKTIEFKNALLTYYHERFKEAKQTTVEIKISVEQFTISGFHHINTWKFESLRG